MRVCVAFCYINTRVMQNTYAGSRQQPLMMLMLLENTSACNVYACHSSKQGLVIVAFFFWWGGGRGQGKQKSPWGLNEANRL